MQAHPIQRQPLNCGKYLALSFALVILIGTLLLTLPISSATGERVPLLSALFTATSAVCVTGLTVINVSAVLSRFGQVVLMCLIQVGGLGFLAFTTLLFAVLGKRLSLKDRLLVRESLSTDSFSGLFRLIYWVFGLTFCIEGLGAAILSIRFIPAYGAGEGIFLSVFHSISAFCNAGFDVLWADSLISVQDDPLLLLTLASLITLGGFGFAPMSDILRNRRFSRLSVHTRLVIILTASLTLSGALFVFLLERNNPLTLGSLSLGEQVLNALFQSVTLRTAGFASLDQAALNPATKLLCSMYMFIGAAPASTGGGVKMTTFFSLMMLIGSISRGREQAVIFRHSLPRRQLEHAACIFLIALTLVLTDIFLLSIFEPGQPLENLMYEAVSAFATVGLSCNLSPSLSVFGRIIIIFTMYIGRVGPLTLALAIARRQSASRDKLKYPEAQILIG